MSEKDQREKVSANVAARRYSSSRTRRAGWLHDQGVDPGRDLAAQRGWRCEEMASSMGGG
jgi:hypothetical protein